MEQITKMVAKSQTPNDRPNDGYDEFINNLSKNIERLELPMGTMLFKTHVEGLWSKFLANLPEDGRQHYTCNACISFIHRYGSLVTINEDGTTTSILWNPDFAPEFFKTAVEALKRQVESSKIAGVFCCGDAILGTPKTGEWSHMHAELPAQFRTRNRLRSSSELQAAYLERFKMVMGALKEYNPNTVTTALTILENDELFSGDKVLGVAKWFNETITSWYSNTPSQTKTRLLWRRVAMAPEGYCHIRASMIGTLLDDIQDGSMDLDTIRRRFSDKMDPLKYMRPQSAPAAANIERAEEIFSKLGLQESLDRKLATINDIAVKLWESKDKPVTETEQGGGIFGHLKSKDTKEDSSNRLLDQMRAKTMTWDRFRQDILPEAVSMQVRLGLGRENFSTFVTQANKDAAPILKWDKADNRNPVSFYLYRNGSTCASKNITPGFNDILAICYDPAAWYCDNPYKIPGNGVNFIIKGAKDINAETGSVGIALFPEDLIPELHEVRSTIEAYSKTAKMILSDDGTGCVAVKMSKDFSYSIELRVTMANGITKYITLDRWI